MNSRSRLAIIIPLLLLAGLVVLYFMRSGSRQDWGTAKLARVFGASLPKKSELPEKSEGPSATDLAGPVTAGATAKETLNKILRKYREAMSHRSPHGSGKFESQAEVHFREARLLALAYPLEMETLLAGLARDPSADRWDRLCSIGLLGVLAKTGMKAAQSMLVEIAKGSEVGYCRAALRELALTDLKGEYLELYTRKCRELVPEAFDAIPLWVQSSSIRELEIIVANSQVDGRPESAVRLLAGWALEKVNILNSGECDKILAKIIDGSQNERDWFSWAVQAATIRSSSILLDALRRRLDRTEAVPTGESGEELKRAGVNPTEELATGGSWGEDPHYDDALVAYAEAGGKLNDTEKRRLCVAGYAGDPKKRLEEILRTEE